MEFKSILTFLYISLWYIAFPACHLFLVLKWVWTLHWLCDHSGNIRDSAFIEFTSLPSVFTTLTTGTADWLSCEHAESVNVTDPVTWWLTESNWTQLTNLSLQQCHCTVLCTAYRSCCHCQCQCGSAVKLQYSKSPTVDLSAELIRL